MNYLSKNLLRKCRTLSDSIRVSKRFLNLQEYQSKALLQAYNIHVQRGNVASDIESAHTIASSIIEESYNKMAIIKAQVLAGGRGKGVFDNGFKGGIKVTKDASQVKEIASKMLRHRLITKQSGAEGEMVKKLLILEGLEFDQEAYLAILMDRKHGGPVLVGSPMGGMDIEEVARSSPEKILTILINITEGVTLEKAQEMATFIGVPSDLIKDASEQIQSLYSLFLGEDATQVEINPFVSAKDSDGTKKMFCVDAKLSFDDNANFRQKNPMRSDESIADEREIKAKRFNLNYIGLDGTIGCMVNGAGLAMATMDIIKLKGKSPANFLDVGGGATEDQVTAAFEILVSDPKVKGILVNIFGGIMKCDVIARGIANAAQKMKLQVPLVVRLEGTNVEMGRKILLESGLRIKTASTMDEAADKIVKLTDNM